MKPCPWCETSQKLSLQKFPDMRHVCAVYCDSCGAWGPGDLPEKAKEKWNRRATDPELEALKHMEGHMRWIAGLNQDVIFEVPEIWGHVLGLCRQEVGKLDKMRGGNEKRNE